MTAETITVDSHTRHVQAQATDPAASAWVSANAGSGKTYVLARRVIRLLLAGSDPASILCLTFTKAAAAEMASRVFGILADWTTLADDALDRVLDDYEAGSAPSTTIVALMRQSARRLFARALETPGGLKIQTIHAFCERLLHQFPFEANVAFSFEVLDEREASILLADAQRRTIAEASASPLTPLGHAFAAVLDAASDQGIDAALAALIGVRDSFQALVARSEDLPAALSLLRLKLGLAPGDTREALNDRIAAEVSFGRDEISRLIDQLSRSGSNDQKTAARLAPYLGAYTSEARANAWIAFIMTADGKKAREITNLCAKKIRDSWPGLEERLDHECRRVEGLLDKVAATDALAATAALLTLGHRVIADYETAKRLRGVLDFQDLVVKTANLLGRAQASAWVHYKLDRGLDHILVDEAQDTSPRQWEVIERLADEFFSGRGARDSLRTFFAVGDEKQSIYSFQGAVPAWFALQRDKIGARAHDGDALWHPLELTLSFRSTPDVLAAVDAIFEPLGAHRGLAREPQPTTHQAARRNQPGRVTYWPPLTAEKQPEPEDWHTPLDRLDEKSLEIRLAERIALTIRDWFDTDATIPATGRPIRPGNILVLTRKRGAQTDAINRALKTAGLAVAGADRLALASHIAVLDLLALAEIVLQPRDDLALASLLKSPLLGLTEEALFGLAYDRRGTLLSALNADNGPAAATLRTWRDRADFMGPYAFFARLLGPDGGRKRLLSRLGPEAEDVLDEFLAQALAYERRTVPSLQGFVAWMRSAATEIKRDADVGRDEIRVMTVHGAKGLEAEIVFLIDTGSKPVHASHDPKIVALADDPDDSAGAPLAWVAPNSRKPAAIQAALDIRRDKAREEYRRLLYVGLTRARDHLIIGGTLKSGTANDRLWVDLVGDALSPTARTVAVTLGGETFDSLEWRKDWDTAGERPLADTGIAVPAAPARLPDWIDRPPPAPPAIPRRLTPSAAVGFAESAPAFAAVTALGAKLDPGASAALDRGRIVHRLLQALPEHEATNRAVIARNYLDGVAPDWAIHSRAEIAARIVAIVNESDFADLFGPDSRAEVPIAGMLDTISGPASVSGRIDRLLVTKDRVLIVDYKTNRPPPAQLDDVPVAYLAQLALYRAVLAMLYPDRIVEAALLWTEGPSLMTIPADSLDRQLAAIVEGRAGITAS